MLLKSRQTHESATISSNLKVEKMAYHISTGTAKKRNIERNKMIKYTRDAKKETTTVLSK